ncbi:MAG: hypothetical protein HZLCBSQH_001937 [Candidatus Fervidibacterota bacterium]
MTMATSSPVRERLEELKTTAGLTGIPEPPIKEVHVFWLAGMSCDGCTIAVTGATAPSIEELLTGAIPGLPRVILHHPVIAVEAGEDFVAWYYKAWRGELGAPYVVVLEGSVPDESRAQRTGGYWAALGVEGADPWMAQPVSVNEWLRRLAPGAAAMIAIGTCATWGGVPAAAGNITGSMSLMDFLGPNYKSALGLPVINIPGCSPVGDNFTETVAAILLYLVGLGPAPEFDELGRPKWLFSETVHRHCVLAGYYEEGTFAEAFGERRCLVKVGCWGPVVQCNIVSRGAIRGKGGCMKVGGVCIGCTMPGFPDKFAPFYKTPPGATFSSLFSKAVGFLMRKLRRISMSERNWTPLWDRKGAVPTPWGKPSRKSWFHRLVDSFYRWWQYRGSVRLDKWQTYEEKEREMEVIWMGR